MEVKVMENILDKNDRIARSLQQIFAEKGVFALNLLGSPGAGKTTLLEKTLASLKGKLRVAVIEGDLFTAKDADRIGALGIPVIQINTGGGCHLDAAMVEKALAKLPLDDIDLLIIENVGNLVCPAEFFIGEDAKATLLSVTEGEDKPLKYPLIFKEASVVLINKTDLLPYLPFDLAAAKEDITTLNPTVCLLEISCQSGDGLAAWRQWLLDQVQKKRTARSC
ncbi:MAG: hydrogenase nickel incorporation protein HypB [Sporomusaceae bacterium]|nr:hydrogenase nickel incorporation protein HypB [Sporomusaceae bacterium]